MTPERIAELKALDDKATLGPWAYVNAGDMGGNAWVVGQFYDVREDDVTKFLTGCVEEHQYDEESGKFVRIADALEIVADAGMRQASGHNIYDAAFIAAARTALPKALDAIERVRTLQKKHLRRELNGSWHALDDPPRLHGTEYVAFADVLAALEGKGE